MRIPYFFLIVTLSVVFVFSVAEVSAKNLTLHELVELFIALQIIPPEKVEQARSVVTEQTQKGAQPVPTSLQTFPSTKTSAFSRNLSIGDAGEDVRNLQELLNTNPLTRVSETGSGSPGNETTYFGPLTEDAVKRFQEIFSDEVLRPLHLTEGTGFFGESTRAKINTFVSAGKITFDSGPEGVLRADDDLNQDSMATSDDTENTGGGVSSQTSLSLISIESDTPVIFYPSRYDGPPGAGVTLRGAGFAADGNIVHFGAERIEGVESSDRSSLSYTVPVKGPGQYSVSVENKNGISNKTSFTITTSNVAPPVIHSIDPVSGVGKTSVTFHGEGFTPTENTVYVYYDILENISSPDGKTLTVEILPPNTAGDTTNLTPDLNDYDPDGTVTDKPESLWFKVQNTNGFSNSVEYKYFYDPDDF